MLTRDVQPLNVNDTDLHPDMTEFPQERVGFTDMTFCLLRFEVANIFRRILYIPPAPNRCNEFFASLSIAEKEKWITECHQRLEEKYLTNMDMTVPLCWVTATVSRLIMRKMWLIVYHPHQRKDGGEFYSHYRMRIMLIKTRCHTPTRDQGQAFHHLPRKH